MFDLEPGVAVIGKEPFPRAQSVLTDLAGQEYHMDEDILVKTNLPRPGIEPGSLRPQLNVFNH